MKLKTVGIVILMLALLSLPGQYMLSGGDGFIVFAGLTFAGLGLVLFFNDKILKLFKK